MLIGGPPNVGKGTGYSAPSLGAITSDTRSTNLAGGAEMFTGLTFTPSTSKALVRILGKSNGSPSPSAITCTIGGTAATAKLFATLAGAGNLIAYVGLVTGLAIGGALAVATSYNDDGGDAVIAIQSITGGTGLSGATGSSVLNAAAASVTATSSAIQQAGSLLVSVGGVAIGTGITPFVAAGWTLNLAAPSGGAGEGIDLTAYFGSRLAGSVGSTASLVLSAADSPATHNHWAAALVELK